MFVSGRNVVTGDVEWHLSGGSGKRRDGDDDDADDAGDDGADDDGDDDAVSNTMHLDMLNDAERNAAYEAAVRQTVQQGQHVLDIGTGSGLLAMMAARAGAAQVTACEVFPVVARAAEQVVAANGLADVIRVVADRSTSVSVPSETMRERAHVLVTEIFDSDLLGEGMLPSVRHALRELLVPGARVIPARAVVYAQFVESEALWAAHGLDRIATPGGHVLADPKETSQCTGAPSACVQASTLRGLVRCASAPFAALTVDFERPPAEGARAHNEVIVTCHAPNDGQQHVAHALLYWWDLYLTDDVVLSTAPIWAKRNGRTTLDERVLSDERTEPLYGWRDHWMQSISYFGDPLPLPSAGTTLRVVACHDDYSIWFHVDRSVEQALVSPPACSCLYHVFNMPDRIRAMNDAPRWQTLASAARHILEPGLRVFVADDGVALATVAAEQLPHDDRTQLVVVEDKSLVTLRQYRSLISRNGFSKSIQCVDQSLDDMLAAGCAPFDAVIAEPFCRALQRDLPWKAVLHYWHIRTKLSPVLKPTCRFMPVRAVVRARPAHLSHLFLSHKRVARVEGFDLSSFNRICGGFDVHVRSTPFYPYNLAFYDHWWTGAEVVVQELDLTTKFSASSLTSSAKLQLNDEDTNAVVVWVDIILCDSPLAVLRGGPSLQTGSVQGVSFVQTEPATTSIGISTAATASGDMTLSLVLQ